MTIDVEISANHVNPQKIKGKTVIVIDVLRATSVMTTALANGALKIIPVKTTNDVFAVARDYPQVIKAGERHAEKVEGFDAGNSPFEFSKPYVKDKVIVMSTTNGTNALLQTKEAKQVIIGSFLNLNAVVRHIEQRRDDIILLCAGTNGEFSLDDALCAGAFVHEIAHKFACRLSDIASAHDQLYRFSKDLHTSLTECMHYNILRSKGLQNDLDYCLTLNILDIVPVWKNGEVRI
ncbi:2-phosphosulfolactate phosphatase [Saccharicrinis sp. FJH54]|uniref:2-phosphosulfolactate phosphatase n=1 Tax=Saccharicrinis sp. FJH54 TaxID=3344665 RepID=UPI0035D46289